MFGRGRTSSKKSEDKAREVTKKWSRQLRSEMRRMDREMRKMDREVAKMKIEIKREAKRSKGAKSKAISTMAKSVVKANHHKERLMTTKVQLNSTCLALKQAEATAKVVGHMETNAAVMKSIGSLMSVQAVAKTARDMQRELAHAGVVEEMIDDALEAADPEDLEEAADEEVESILNEILSGELNKAGEMKGRALGAAEQQAEEEDVVDPEEEKELKEMRARLAALDAS